MNLSDMDGNHIRYLGMVSILNERLCRMRLGADWSVDAWGVYANGDIFVCDSECDDSTTGNRVWEVVRRTLDDVEGEYTFETIVSGTDIQVLTWIEDLLDDLAIA
jgi:hypothetical protein